MADAEQQEEIVVETNDAKKIIEDMIKVLEKSYEDTSEFTDSDEIWVKFVVKGKRNKLKMVKGGTGNSIASIADAMEEKQVSQIWCVTRAHDDDGPLRTMVCVWYFQAEGLSVSQRSHYQFNKTFIETMSMSPSISEQVDTAEKTSGWPNQDIGEGKLKWQQYLETVKKNAGAHSVKNYLFGKDEVVSFAA